MEHQHHEDNANFGVTNSHFMDLQFNQQVEIVSGRMDEGGIGGPAGIGSTVDAGVCIGGKFEEHIEGEGDDEEWKYIKEKHQSEKQQSQQVLLDEFDEGERAGHEVDVLGHFHEHNVYGTDGATKSAATNGAENGTNIVEVIKQDGELSTTNTSSTHSPGDDKDVSAEVLQVEMKIEAAPQQPITEDFDDEEPSSLATNGTSSLSEHQLQHHVQEEQYATAVIEDVETKERSTGHDFEMHSQLNPEAKVFVPSFGSNPASPSTAPVSGLGFGDEATEFQFTSNEVARHFLGYQNQSDDFVAQSPHKERCADMEAIQLPGEKEFDNEAAKRPHELEKEELLLSEDARAGGDDCQYFNRQSPSSFVDHGPETSVDLDNDLISEMQPMSDVMEQSIYVESTHNVAEEPIEDLLNTVQPLPTETESLNGSYNNEEELLEQINSEREMFQERSHSHAVEEMQMNLRNDLYTAEHAAFPTQDSPMKEEQNLIADSSNEQPPFLQIEERSLLMDISNPFDHNNVSVMADTEASFEAVNTVAYSESKAESNEPVFAAQTDALVSSQNLQFNADFAHDLIKQTNETPISPSPLSTEEKHLVEDTKESPQLFSDNYVKLAQNMGDLQLTHKDNGNSAQMEPICEIANAIHETANPITVPEPVELEHDKEIDQPHTVELLQTEEIYKNEQLLQPLKADELLQQAANEHLEQKYESKLEDEEVVAPPAETEPKEEPLETEITVKDDNSAAVATAVAAATTATAAAAVAAATTATAAAAVAASTKKTAVVAKKSVANAITSKPKAPTAETKKSLDSKKPATVAAAPKPAMAARPRTAPAKCTTSISNMVVEKKASATPLTSAPSVRKPFTARPAPKTTTAAPRPVTAHAAPKTSSSTTTVSKSTTLPARKATGTSGSATSSIKSRVSGGLSPSKPTTLGVGVACAASTKPKQISPRANLSSQLRKAGGVGTGTAKSPTKPASSVDLASRTSATASSRPKTIGATVSSTTMTATTTKRFVARPAPKSILSNSEVGAGAATTTTASRRVTTTSAKNSAVAEKTSLTVNGTAASKKLTTKASALSPKLSATRASTTTAPAKSPRTKDATAAAKKPSLISKTVKDTKQGAGDKPNTNGSIEEPKLNGDSNIENGVHHSFEVADHIAPVTDAIGSAPVQEAALIDA